MCWSIDRLSQRLMIYSDGGARGNPGSAAIAFLANDGTGELVKAGSRFIGIHTNNQAEYEALLMALTFAADLQAEEIICHLDSELVVRQLNGQYAVKNAALQQLHRQVVSLLDHFKKVSFVNVPRSHPQIQRADALVNKVLDEQAKMGQELKNQYKSSVRSCEGGFESMFAHVSIRTSNMERSISFYSRFLGLKVKSRLEIKQTNAQIVFLQGVAGKGCTLELTFYRSQTKFTQPVYQERLFDHLGFEVTDIKRIIEAMRKENVTVTDEPFELNSETTIAFVEDPDGTLIELIERK
jgi:ribonuclease HI